jgi:glycosyltransferase involved in cell wall biosynthesis
MDTLPRITVITPSYNQAHFIEQTIKSVLSQNYPALEHIVMDGGSTDSTLEILKKYDGRLCWISERDRGQSHALNKGLAMASGDIIAFLNSDDLYAAGALLKVGRFFAAHPKVCWLTGRCRTIDQHEKEIRKAITLYKNIWLRTSSYRVLLVLNYISQPATFWTRNVMDTVGEFDESLRYAMDYDYWLRVGRSFKLWVLDDYLASFRVHASSKAGSSAHAQFDSDLQIAKRYNTSPLLVRLHAAHNAFTVMAYRLLMSSGGRRTHVNMSGME